MSAFRDLETKVFERVNPLVRFSVTRYVLAVGLFIAVVAFGLISTLTLGVDQFPNINIPVVAVTTLYPGATPSVIDQQVTKVIENIVSSVKGVTDIESSSSTGASQVIIFFDQNSDQNTDANQVAAQVSAAVRQLPSGVDPPTVQTYDPNNFPILQFGIAGQGANLADVADYVQNDLAPVLTLVSGVANIKVDGGPTRTFQVLLDPNKLQSYNLTPQQIVNAIKMSAINRPIGTFASHNNSMAFVTENVPESVNQIGRIMVDPARSVMVNDISAVRDLPVPTNYARVNGKPVVLVSVLQTPTSNAVAVVDSTSGRHAAPGVFHNIQQ
jgi:HAE1 family hydrophobic/amphiphilic exporter-1